MYKNKFYNNKYIDKLLVIFFVAITLAIWLSIAPLTNRFSSLDATLGSVGKIAGLMAITLFSITLLLTTRLKIIERLTNGLDKTYKLHKYTGAIAFVLILFHPMLLASRFIPNNWKVASNYFIPGTSWSMNLGMIALALMIILISLTFYFKIKYNIWKNTHKYLGWAFIIACIHLFLIGSDVSQSKILFSWMMFVAIVGTISFFYSAYLSNIILRKYKYFISKISTKNNYTFITLKSKNIHLKYLPGQFIYVQFDNEEFKESHPFTIATSPNEKNEIRLIVKNIGDYTSKIKYLKIGTKAFIEGPYGTFNYEKENSNQIWIAGGIGITPFLSFANTFNNKNKKSNRKIKLYYCTKTKEEQICIDELKAAQIKNKNFKFDEFLTEKKGRIKIEVIEKETNIDDKTFYICGPTSMMNDLQKQLIRRGVSKKKILFEEFSLK